MPETTETCIKPWGHWLFPNRRNGTIWSVTDGNGREYGGVREAFWVGRLHMCGCDYRIVNEQLATMETVLAAANMPASRREPLAMLFGDGVKFMFYMYWLSSLGFIDHGFSPFDQVATSEEGRAVLEMLRLTRPDERIGVAPKWFPTDPRPVARIHQRRRGQLLLAPPSPDNA